MSSPRQPASGYQSGVPAARKATDDRTTGRTIDERTTGYDGYQPYVGDTGVGTTAVAAFLMVLGGLWSFFVGLGLVVRASYFTSLPGYTSAARNYPYHWNLTSWGWASLILGIVVVIAGVCVLLGQSWARWAGIVLAVISGVGTFLFLPFYPLWSILVIALDVFIIWALATARRRQDV